MPSTINRLYLSIEGKESATMSKRYANLTSPLKIRGKTLKSRLLYPVVQPHFFQANELYPADPIVSYYTSRAKNGAAIILMHDLTDLDQRRDGGGDCRQPGNMRNAIRDAYDIARRI
jgi:2,4-dienoyl-CoA reductase-like NADH-dependent reductase (Old Yellow Enzyme family)